MTSFEEKDIKIAVAQCFNKAFELHPPKDMSQASKETLYRWTDWLYQILRAKQSAWVKVEREQEHETTDKSRLDAESAAIELLPDDE